MLFIGFLQYNPSTDRLESAVLIATTMRLWVMVMLPLKERGEKEKKRERIWMSAGLSTMDEMTSGWVANAR